jgi:RNA polymerase sigma-70 factor (ECF subfamily)
MSRVKEDDDPRAFAQLAGRWRRPIQNLCARMSGDLHRGEDLAQEVFARLFARRKGYEPTGKFSTFLWRMALNICYDDLRKTARRRELSLDSDDAAGESPLELFPTNEAAPDDAMIEGEGADAVRRALVALAEPYRVVVVLRHYEDLKFREIADVLGLPEGTVKSRMAEALTQLNKMLNPLFVERAARVRPTHERLLI